MGGLSLRSSLVPIKTDYSLTSRLEIYPSDLDKKFQNLELDLDAEMSINSQFDKINGSSEIVIRQGDSPQAFIRKPIATNIEYDFKNGNSLISRLVRQLYHASRL